MWQAMTVQRFGTLVSFAVTHVTGPSDLTCTFTHCESFSFNEPVECKDLILSVIGVEWIWSADGMILEWNRQVLGKILNGNFLHKKKGGSPNMITPLGHTLFDVRATLPEVQTGELYIKIQSVPHSKHSPSQLYKPVS